MNEFGLPPEDKDYIIRAYLENPTNKPIQIISDEYKELNKRVLQPRQKLPISLEIPAGYREFIRPDVVCGQQVVFVGRILAEAAEPLVYTIND